MSDDQIDAAAEQAAEIAQPFEGFSARPYLDTVAVPHVWTIGFGSIWWFDGSPVTATTRAITRGEGVQLMHNEMLPIVQKIAADVGAPLSANALAALGDFAFNVGIGAFESSTLLRDLRVGNYDAAAQQFLVWDHAGGREIVGLLRRRAAEAITFETPDRAPSASGVSATTASAS